MADFNSKYSGEQVEEFLDQIANGEIGGGGVETETDPIFSASPAASITEEKKTEWDNKQDSIEDLDAIRSGAALGNTALQSIPDEYVIEDELVLAKQKATIAIERYDSSSEVNCFYIGGIPMWLDKATRAGLMLRFQSEQAIGKEMTSLWYNGQVYELPLETAFQMLFALEVYASACYDNTQRHLAAVGELESIEQIEAYNYREGYPNKLEF